MTTRETYMRKLRRLKPRLREEYGVTSLGIFGSWADGSQSDESDVDLLVEFERPIGWRFFTLEKLLEDTLERKIDLATSAALKDRIKPEILRQVQYV